AAVEFVLAQPTGQTGLAEGPLTITEDGFTSRLESRVVNSATAKHVETTVRRIALAGDVLTTTFAMPAVGVPLPHHLVSQMHRCGCSGPGAPDRPPGRPARPRPAGPRLDRLGPGSGDKASGSVRPMRTRQRSGPSSSASQVNLPVCSAAN